MIKLWLWKALIESMNAEGNHNTGRRASFGSFEDEGSEAGSDSRPSPAKRRRRASVDESGSTLQERWDEMYERLKRYKNATGNCNVPNRYPEDPQLGFWVSTQRRQYRVLTSGGSTSSALTVQRAQKLIQLGFEWSAKDPRMVPWETRYRQLQEFVAKYKHAQVPIGWEENVALSNWVSKQRQEYKMLQKGKPSRLTKERIDKLNRTGFVWEAKRGAPRQVMPGAPESPLDAGSPEQAYRRSSAVAHPTIPLDSYGDSVVGDAQAHENAATHVTSRPARGMEPVSPPNSAAAPSASLTEHAPPVRLPPPAQANYSYGSEAAYPGVLPPPNRQDYYYPSQPRQPQYYQPMYPPPFPHHTQPSAPFWFSVPFRPPENFSSTSAPFSQAPTWSMHRTGRVLTPLLPLDLPAGSSRYPVPPAAEPRDSYESTASAFDRGVRFEPHQGSAGAGAGAPAPGLSHGGQEENEASGQELNLSRGRQEWDEASGQNLYRNYDERGHQYDERGHQYDERGHQYDERGHQYDERRHQY